MPISLFANHNFCTWRNVVRIDEGKNTALGTAAHIRKRLVGMEKGTACHTPTLSVPAMD